jgi:hypothetical protein
VKTPRDAKSPHYPEKQGDALNMAGHQEALGTRNRKRGGTVTYRYYFSGFMNMEKDPAGKLITYYFDEKGRSTGAT